MDKGGRWSPEPDYPGKGGYSMAHAHEGIARALDSMAMNAQAQLLSRQVQQPLYMHGQSQIPHHTPQPQQSNQFGGYGPPPGHIQVQKPPAAKIPENGWQYIDTNNDIQGPFPLKDMQDWSRCGYFRADLKVRYTGQQQFRNLQDLYPDMRTAFQHAPRV